MTQLYKLQKKTKKWHDPIFYVNGGATCMSEQAISSIEEHYFKQ